MPINSYANQQKIEPKLRMYANCEQSVNEVRAHLNANLFVSSPKLLKSPPLELVNSMEPQKMEISYKKTKLRKPSSNISSNVFVQWSKISRQKVNGELIRRGNQLSASLPLTELAKLAANDDVVGIELPRVLRLADPSVVNKYAKQPSTNNTLTALRKKFPAKHKVLIGIIDVGGFDFSHPDFLDAKGQTRFVSIWDQGSDARPSPKPFGYGAEFTQVQLNQALRKAPSVGVPATAIEKQSSMTEGSHGTHVASIAAGNSGVFPDADIAAVTIALKSNDIDGRKSFYDSASLVHAFEYLLRLAERLKLPVSINVSLGTNGHAHDGSDAASRWINAELALPGRCVCVAAGNAGQERPLTDNDLGYTMGRIHTSGKIEATGLSKDVFWTVAGNGVSDVSENELEIWYAPQDRFSVMIKPPGLDWIGPVKANEYIENQQLKDGSYLSIYNDLFHFSNGSNYIGIYLSPNYKETNKYPIRAGIWQVRLIGDDIRNGSYDGWIERDDPRPVGNLGSRQTWNFPSYFTEKSNVDNSSISSLACANYVIAVGNCDPVEQRINISSSQGPTRDKRNKPEIIAPGTNIVAAKGFSGQQDRWISMTGTSMASPYACGVAAWMLSQDKNLSAAQIQGIMIRTSNPLPGCDYDWKDDCGFGLIQPEACLEQANTIRHKKDLTNDSYNLPVKKG